MNKLVSIAVLALLTGCGGGGGGSAGSKNDLAAQACDTYAKSQLGDKTYSLDKKVLGASLVPESDGSMSLKGPIIVEPGRSTESKQSLECNVRFVEGKDLPDVIKMQFIW
jgi:hypothetical protein